MATNGEQRDDFVDDVIRRDERLPIFREKPAGDGVLGVLCNVGGEPDARIDENHYLPP